MEIDLVIYEHKPMTLDSKCPKITSEQDSCPIYDKMRYQHVFNEQDLDHLHDYEHDTIDCRYGTECYAFITIFESIEVKRKFQFCEFGKILKTRWYFIRQN